MSKALRSNRRQLPPIHSANNGIVFIEENKAAVFAHRTVEDLREEKSNDGELTIGTSSNEVRAIIQNLKPRKAPGPDHIPNKSLKNLSDKAVIACRYQCYVQISFLSRYMEI